MTRGRLKKPDTIGLPAQSPPPTPRRWSEDLPANHENSELHKLSTDPASVEATTDRWSVVVPPTQGRWRRRARPDVALAINHRSTDAGSVEAFAFSIFHFSFLIPLLMLLGANRIDGKRLEGFTEPYQTIAVAAAENGIVQEVRVELGQAVKKGEALGTLDDDLLKATLEIGQLKANSTAAIDAAKAELDIKEQKLNALTDINRTGGGSREELTRAKADVELGRARLKAAQETLAADRLEVKRIETQLQRRTIRSPIDGVVTEIHREPGEFLSITEPKLFTVVRLDRLRAKFYIPSENAQRFSKGHRVKVSGHGDEKPLTGDVEFVSPVTHAESGLVRVDVIFDNRDGRLRSGQRLTISGE